MQRCGSGAAAYLGVEVHGTVFKHTVSKLKREYSTIVAAGGLRQSHLGSEVVQPATCATWPLVLHMKPKPTCNGAQSFSAPVCGCHEARVQPNK